MSKNYDNWEKLVGAVLNREELRRIAKCDSLSSCEESSYFSFNSDYDRSVVHEEWSTQSDGDGSFRERLLLGVEDINLNVGSGSELGESTTIKNGTGVSFTIQRTLRYLLHQIPRDKVTVKRVGLSRSTGKKFCVLGARGLQIAWIDNRRYWKWTHLPESRFAEVAVLLEVCWLDIRGIFKAHMLSPSTTYAAYLVFKLSERHYGLDCSSNASVKIVKKSGTEIEGETSTVHIVPPTQESLMWRRRQVELPVTNVRVPRSRTQGGWLEIELGEFFNDEGDGLDVHVRLCEIEELNWKGGLIVEGIELRPKEDF